MQIRYTPFMRRPLVPISAFILILFCGLSAAAASPRIEYRTRRLENGLTLYAIQDNSLPHVAVQMWYRVGGKDDPPARSGMAHLLQHMMFGRTRSFGEGGFDKIVEDLGGNTNARTDYDYTVFDTEIPAAGLERLLWAEGERMVHLVPTSEGLQTARGAVGTQWTTGVQDSPYGRLDLIIGQRSFEKSYRRPVIGLPDEVNAITLAEIKSFYQAHYRPDNAVLVVAGDFTQPKLDAWVDRYFGSISASEMPSVRMAESEPLRANERRFREIRRGLPLPALAVTYLLPGATDTNLPAWDVLQAALSEGESSRLSQSLVEEKRLAASAIAYADVRQESGLFILRLTIASGRRVEEGERALMAEIARLQAAPLSVMDLERAKSIALGILLRERQSRAGRAAAVGLAAVLTNDAARANNDIARLLSVTTQDIQNLAKTYLVPQNRVVISYVPEGSTLAATSSSRPSRLPPVKAAPFTPPRPAVTAATPPKIKPAVRTDSHTKRRPPVRRFRRRPVRRIAPMFKPTAARPAITPIRRTVKPKGTR